MSDEPLPELTARDDARLLVQSPRRLFLYWSFARDPRVVLRNALGALAEQFELGARLVDLEDETIGAPFAAHGREIWFDADPRCTYRAEVGFFAEGQPFVRVLASNIVQTPSDDVSPFVDESADFQIDAADFSRLLATSGFGSVVLTSAPNLIVEPQGACVASGVSSVSSFVFSKFAPSSFVLGVAAPKRRE